MTDPFAPKLDDTVSRVVDDLRSRDSLCIVPRNHMWDVLLTLAFHPDLVERLHKLAVAHAEAVRDA